MNVHKALKALWRALPFALITFLLLATFLYPDPAKTERAEASQRVVHVWNVDTFEGGKGSRTSFLSKVARRTEAEHEGLYYFVTSYSAEGARAALKEGRSPDILSFGVGLADHLEKCLPLPYAFSGGEVGGKCLAVPWCRGKYVLFAHSEDKFASGNAVISRGGSNLARVAAALCGIEGAEERSEEAYTHFLGGKYDLLLGTQRDICRFAARGMSVCTRELEGFCDLYQYVSVLSKEHWDDCMLLIGELLSARTQEMLDGIGMFPAEGGSGKTVGVFSSDEALFAIEEAAKQEDRNFSEKFLKII